MSWWRNLTGSIFPGYAGASSGRRFRGLRVGDAGPNRLLLAEGSELRRRARWFTRSEELAGAAADKLTANVIGTGIRPRFLHPDPARRRELDELWGEWAQECDATGQDDFAGLQRLAFRSMMVDGESLLRWRSEGRRPGRLLPLELQAIEADQLPYEETYDRALRAEGRRVTGGVETNAVGRPVAYHLLPEHPRDGLTGFASSGRTVRVRASEIAHLMVRLRPGQLRGEPWMARALERMWQVRLYDRAEGDRKSWASRLGGWLQRAPGDEDGRFPLGDTREPDASGTQDVTLEPGVFPVIPAGFELHTLDSKDPQGSYETYLLQQLLLIAAGVGLPYDVLTGDLRQANYSSLRAGRIELRREIRTHRALMIRRLCRPAVERFLDGLFAEGVLRDPAYPANRRDYLRLGWQFPEEEWVDPLKEAMGVIRLYEARLISWRQAVEELGRDPEEVRADLEAEAGDALLPTPSGAGAADPRPQSGGRPSRPVPGEGGPPAATAGRVQ